MTEHDAALAFDQALDGTYTHDLNGTEPLVQTANTVQSLFDRQHAIPSEEFVMGLEQSLFPTLGIQPNAERSPAVAATPPQPVHPRVSNRSRQTRASHAWLAIAAALVLFIGGMGAIISGPLGLRATPEPSSIPAVSMGTVEASPQPMPAKQPWSVSPPIVAEGSAAQPFIANGMMYSIFNDTSGVYARVIDIEAGLPLWDSRLLYSGDITAAIWRDHLLYTGTGGVDYALFALDGRTGEERWRISLPQRPVNLVVDGDTAFVLGSGNLVTAVDLATQQQRWQTDLSSYDPNQKPYGGMNQYVYQAGGRLAVTDGMVGVVTSSGRLVGLDSSDGSEEWSDPRSNDGRLTLDVIAGRFVVTAEGKSIYGMEDDPYLLPATPVPSFDPKTQPCERTIEHLVETDTRELGDFETSATSIEPATGEQRWTVRTHAAVWLSPADSSDLLAHIRPGWDPALENEDFSIYCRINGKDGSISRTTGLEFVDAVMTHPNTGAPIGIGGTQSGLPIWVSDIDVVSAMTFPRFDPDTQPFRGFRWAMRANDLVLITEQNGTVVGLPNNGPRWSTTKPSTPEAETMIPAEVAWTSTPLDEPFSSMGRSVNDDERLYLGYESRDSLFTGTVRALDLESGAEVWRIPTNGSVRTMLVSDGLLMFAEVQLLGANSAVVALDAETGQEVWRADLSDRLGAMTVVDDRVLVLTESNALNVIDLESGQSLSVTNIGGRAKPNGTISYSGEFRLAVMDDLLIAVLYDGSVAGVDLETGNGRWWALRKTPGETRIALVDDALIVVASGEPEMVELDENGSPVAIASPLSVGTPETVSCARSVELAIPGPTIDGEGLQTGETLIMRLDPTDGTTIWNASASGRYELGFESDAGILSIVSTSNVLPIDRSQITLCATDPATGRVETVERFADVVDHAYLYQFTYPPDDRTIELIGGVDGADGLVLINAAFDPSVTGPRIVDSALYAQELYLFHAQGSSLFFAFKDGSISRVELSPDA